MLSISTLPIQKFSIHLITSLVQDTATSILLPTVNLQNLMSATATPDFRWFVTRLVWHLRNKQHPAKEV